MSKLNPFLTCIINNSLLKFSYVLLKHIFLKSEKSTLEKEKLNIWIEKVNENIIRNEKKFLKVEYSIQNFDNIVNFIKSQNLIYAAEILEYIMLKIFVQAFKVKKEKTLNEYIHNNLSKIREDNTYLSWFQTKKFSPIELFNLEKIFNNQNISYFHNSPFSYLLYQINYEKYNLLRFCKEKNNQIIKLIYKDCIPNQEILDNIYKTFPDKSNNQWDKDNKINSIMSLNSNFIQKNYSNEQKVYTDIIKRFFYSVFIYYQTKNSPLINYGKENDEKNLTKVPYCYDFYGAYIEGRYANTLISPIRAEKRVEKILFDQNNIRESGMFELGKSFQFNENIKTIQISKCLIKSYYLDYLILGMGCFDNYSVKELNLSYNYLTANTESSLRKILHKFKGLTVLNLSFNKFINGLSSFFELLKKLYQKKEIKIEILYLNGCNLDDSSLFELGELLKNKFCKLKKLYLMENNYTKTTTNFLKKLKKNKILTEIYLGKNHINNEDVNDINKIISNSGINYLNIFKSDISNFQNIIKIIYRTRIINDFKNKKNKNIIDKSNVVLKSLDLSHCDIINKNSKYIPFLSKISYESSLTVLDFAGVLYGYTPQKIIKTKKNEKYRNEVDNFVKILSDKKSQFKKLNDELRKCQIDIKRLKEDAHNDGFDIKDNALEKIVNDKKSKFMLYLREIATKIIEEEKNIENDKEEKINKLANYFMLQRTKNYINDINKIKDSYNFMII